MSRISVDDESTEFAVDWSTLNAAEGSRIMPAAARQLVNTDVKGILVTGKFRWNELRRVLNTETVERSGERRHMSAKPAPGSA
jgi:hypothetical protein